MGEVRWEKMFPDELEVMFQRRPVLFLPYGLCEPHGPHNALGLDGLKAHAICVRAAELAGGIVAPADWWHVHEVGYYAAWAELKIGRVERKWLTAVPPWVHFKNVCYHVRAAEQIGFQAVILFTGHYGPNWQDLKTLVDLLQPHVAARLHGLPEFEANTLGFDGDGTYRDHAGKIETSLLWSLTPECVDASRLPHGGTDVGTKRYFGMGPDAAKADRRIGGRMVACEAEYLAHKADELLAAFAAETPFPPVSRLRTFEDVEQFWNLYVRPVLAEFRSMQDYVVPSADVLAIPGDSVWKATSTGPLRG